MIKKETVLYYAKNREDTMFLSGIYDNYVKASTKGIAVFSRFMSERKQAMIKEAFSSDEFITPYFYGGFDGAERKMVCFSEEEVSCYPVKVLKLRLKSNKELNHRDFLGALMNLGIKRDVLGDILSNEEILVFVKADMAEYIINNLSKINKFTVEAEEYEGNNFPELSEGKDFFETVASLRLDSVVSCGFSLSRDKAKKLIESGRVFVNSLPLESSDFKLKEEDVVSARGFGRFTLKEVKGLSKKGRIMITINKSV